MWYVDCIVEGYEKIDRALKMLLETNGPSYIVMKVTEKKSRGVYVYTIRLVNAFPMYMNPYDPLKSMSNSPLPHTVRGPLTHNVLQG